ncbi:Inositol-1-monophosphatase [Candidatus Xiphinematobacter sp. Idaho Grape]|uniref:inositol monophosphatase family protein n=1 Tax=Candidatus Xiphinematobacter sp. Idaho Grape TaxID=1704307 RepID=UPI0007062105|nr:inositol monophosphatase family protein [Candidatus Xiphinematobacter sp. Idaho Grape]ALJ56730.1 Inositol-1-monophosphatase [Candidatus Xiphinematobacter sp. Idaho Grape]
MQTFLQSACEAVLKTGGFLRSHFGKELHVDTREAHDIKLELDRRSQKLIEEILLGYHPDHTIYGEEGIVEGSSAYQWIVDPIDGTSNFFWGIPHFSISIALRYRGQVLVGVIYDPIRNELWAVEQGATPTLNGVQIFVSRRKTLADAVISVGISKSLESIQSGLTLFQRMVRVVNKCRIMGSAALDMAYVACGRLDVYIESQINLWDIAAGMALVEEAGGKVELSPHPVKLGKYSIVATNGNIRLSL